jgi:hypothetical protein
MPEVNQAKEDAVLMRVCERGNEIQIELTGVAGRHEQILRAVFACRLSAAHSGDAHLLPQVSVKTRSNTMRISLRCVQGGHMEPDAVYRSLRQALFSVQPAAV